MNKILVTTMSLLGMFFGIANANAFEIKDVLYDVAVYDIADKSVVYQGKVAGYLMGVNTTTHVDCVENGKEVSANFKFLPRSMTKDSLTIGVSGVVQINDGSFDYKTVKFNAQDFKFKNEYSYVMDAFDEQGKKYRLVVNTYINHKNM